MPDEFDPYHTWLAIPADEQPPNHYRLLGVRLFEDDMDVLLNAADQRMAHLRSFQSGKRAETADRLLNEVSLARLCLLDPRKKATYDARLGTSSPPETAGRQHADDVDGTVFGEYVLLDQIGKGTTGHVFKAKHTTMGRIVALKTLLADMTSTEDKVARFRREVKILSQLSHPNLVTAYDAGERDGVHYLIMEYVDGETLTSLLRRAGPLSVEHAINYVLQAAGVLGFVHANGIQHSNVKPSNLMVNRQGVVKLTGLGLARIDLRITPLDADVEDAATAGRVMGTIDYMAPEQTMPGSKVDYRADIYALGCTLYTLLSAKPPYSMKTLHEKIVAHRSAPAPSLFEWRSDIPYALDTIFRRMLAKRPEERPRSMNEVITGLQAI